MNIRNKRLSLNIGSTALLSLAGLLIGWSLRAIDEPRSADAVPQAAKTDEVVEQAPVSRSPEDFAQFWDKPIHKSLESLKPSIPPPAVKPKPKPQPKPPIRLNLTLIGTAIENGGSHAIVTDAKGQLDVKGVGEILNLTPRDVRIEDIQAKVVTLSYRGSIVKLQLKEPN